MSPQLETEFNALKREYYSYLQRFRAMRRDAHGAEPLSVRQYCAAAVLYDEAWHNNDLRALSELQSLMLLA
jgi:hypothetical protein